MDNYTTPTTPPLWQLHCDDEEEALDHHHHDHLPYPSLHSSSSMPDFTFPQPPLSIPSGSNLGANNHHPQPLLITSPTNYTPRRRKKSVAFDGDKGGEEEEEQGGANRTTKKMIHRDVEKQRRKEMTTLYSSLRSLLPIDYLKGKRAISDHIHQAANYIKYQEGKIKELGCKRDELKKKLCFNNNTTTTNHHATTNLVISTGNASALASSSSSSSTSNSATNGGYHHGQNDECVVTVRTCLVGFEVIMEAGSYVGVSTILGVLIKEGLNVVSCISAKVNHGMVHNIKAEVCDGRSIDAAQLQEKLTNSRLIRSLPSEIKMVGDHERN